MLNISIVDDNEEILNIIKNLIDAHMEGSVDISLFTDPQMVVADLKTEHYSDIYFLDIEMPDMNGLELAKIIRHHRKHATIIFLTSHPEYALRGYDTEIQAYHYILKSEMEEKIPLALESLTQNFSVNRYYIIQNNVRFEKLALDDILFIQKSTKNSVIHTKDSKYEVRKTMEHLLEEINCPDLIFVERGSIVNMQHIKSILNNMITMDDGTEIIISRYRIRDVKEKVNEYWSNRLCRSY